MQRSFQLYRAYAIIPGQLEQGMNETKKLYACYVLAKADAGIARSLRLPLYASVFLSAKGAMALASQVLTTLRCRPPLLRIEFYELGFCMSKAFDYRFDCQSGHVRGHMFL